MATPMSFALNNRPVLSQNAGRAASFRSCRAHLSRQRSSPFVDVEHRQHGKSPVGILRQAAIANLGKAPETLQGQEGMLDLGTHTRLAPIGFLVGVRQRTVAVGAFVGEVLCPWCEALEPLTLFLAAIGAVTIEARFVPVQQVWHLMAVMDVGGGDARTVNQPGLTVCPDVQLHTEV